METVRKWEIALPRVRYLVQKAGPSFEWHLSDNVMEAVRGRHIHPEEVVTFCDILWYEMLNKISEKKHPVPKMDKERMGEIAYLFLQWVTRIKGVELKGDLLRRQAGSEAKDIRPRNVRISTDEMVEFKKELIKDAFEL